MDEPRSKVKKGMNCQCPLCDVPECPDPGKDNSCCTATLAEPHLLDCVGLYCPLPVMRAKEEIDSMEAGKLLEIVADDPAAAEDIPRWTKRTGNKLIRSWREEDELHFLVQKKRRLPEDV